MLLGELPVTQNDRIQSHSTHLATKQHVKLPRLHTAPSVRIVSVAYCHSEASYPLQNSKLNLGEISSRVARDSHSGLWFAALSESRGQSASGEPAQIQLPQEAPMHPQQLQSRCLLLLQSRDRDHFQRLALFHRAGSSTTTVSSSTKMVLKTCSLTQRYREGGLSW